METNSSNLLSEHKYSIQEDPANGVVLMKDDNQVFCHHVQPIPTQGAISGQINFFRFPCCTNCSKAEILKDEADGELYYVISCDGNTKQLKLEKPKEKTKFTIL
jgi:hypothetical protein